ncbi:hypothetical protein LLT6_09860 [Lactococcus cremoris subsp. cremoris TIFN6]|uniref:Xylose isomerase-like TIM barrel domain-containing protein n=3 Tax=Lactococcus TaxID=1357 RepID=T0TL39_LACLC|nr:hypothetical protein LLT6_09860 [Lactococcus cremoris subsp. cremoris TIFN6]
MDLTKVAEYIEVNSFKNVGILFDVGNAALVERGFKITDMSKIKNFVQHVHLKNFIHENDVVKFVNLEEGELNYKQIFEFLEENFRDREVKLGVETDVWSPQCRKKTFF